MTTAVQITAIICCTIVALALIFVLMCYLGGKVKK